MRVLFLDCFSGISGDMTVGVLRDLGVDEAVFRSSVAAINLATAIDLRFRRETRQGIAGWKFEARLKRLHEPSRHGHSHGASHREIRGMIESSGLAEAVKARSISVFQRLALAEGKIHGVAPDDVEFHEVGAFDSIADIVAACAGIDALAVDGVLASSLVDGTGWTDCAHGRLPVPAPATLEILAGIPLRQLPDAGELITPTGAALLAEFSSTFGPFPEMTIEKVGYGLGTRNDGPRPNVLRALVGQLEASVGETDEIVQMETNLDDLNPELAGAAMERLLGAGALDVFFTPAQMKKNRPGFVFSVLCKEEKSQELARILLTETTAFGLRMQRKQRVKLERTFQIRETPYGPVRVKLGSLGGKLVQAAPEFESCREAALRTGASVREVYLAAARNTPSRLEGSP